MKFDIVSDFHLDFNKSIFWEHIKKTNTLVVAGDHSNEFTRLTLKSLKMAKHVYDNVIFVDGNHEWYYMNKKMEDGYAYMAEQLDKIGVIFLNGSSVVFDDTMFVGANGWYDLKAVGTLEKNIEIFKRESNDYSHIWLKNSHRNPIIESINDMFEIKSLVESAQNDDTIKKIVVITHTAPRIELVGIPGVTFDEFDSAYVNTNMSCVVDADANKKISCWCYGHTHIRKDKTIDGIRYINNSRGYRDNGTWNMIEVNTEDDYYSIFKN
ncbi:MAG: metallophosphoesterase [Candidimonas sp.]